MSEYNQEEIIKAAVGNADIKGFYLDETDAGQTWRLDRRYTEEAIGRYGLSPRTADLNLIGPDVVSVPAWLASELGLDESSDGR